MLAANMGTCSPTWTALKRTQGPGAVSVHMKSWRTYNTPVPDVSWSAPPAGDERPWEAKRDSGQVREGKESYACGRLDGKQNLLVSKTADRIPRGEPIRSTLSRSLELWRCRGRKNWWVRKTVLAFSVAGLYKNYDREPCPPRYPWLFFVSLLQDRIQVTHDSVGMIIEQPIWYFSFHSYYDDRQFSINVHFIQLLVACWSVR